MPSTLINLRKQVTMTDKQIIIDGVDVSGCENYGETMAKTHNCTLYDEYLRPCKGTNCYYKNWKRKEQECEELKKLLKVRIEDLCDSCGASSMMPMPCKVYEKTLTEIKELLLKTPTDSPMHCVNAKSVILQKISECEGNDN